MKNEVSHKAWFEKYSRLMYVLSSKGMSVNALERQLGLSHRALARPFKFDEIIRSKFAPEYPDINTEWILSGIGDMMRYNAEPSDSMSNVYYEMLQARDKRIQELERKILELSQKLGTLQRLQNHI